MSAIAPETGLSMTLDLKAVNDDGFFSGYASVFGEIDRGRDMVMPGAFTKSLLAIPAARVKMLREHNRAEPIGYYTVIREDTKGLYVEGQLILDTALGRETHVLMKAGVLDGMSIGYRTKSARLDKTKGARMLDEIELHEISIVTFPMLPSATVTAVKSSHKNGSIVEAIEAARATLKGTK